MKPNSIISAVTVFCAVLLFSACDDDDPAPENPEELITTLRLEFTPLAGGPTRVLEFRDLDGDGGNVPVVTTDALNAHSNYTLSLILLNEAASPVIDIAAEVLDEAEEHQFFFVVDGTTMEIVYEDEDANGNPIGLVNTASTNEAGTGTLTVILRHEPDKFAGGVSTGLIDNAGGSTDLEVVFDLDIE